MPRMYTVLSLCLSADISGMPKYLPTNLLQTDIFLKPILFSMRIDVNKNVGALNFTTTTKMFNSKLVVARLCVFIKHVVYSSRLVKFQQAI